MSDYESGIFINCPFDKEYIPLLNALLFVIFDCGFTPRCSKEIIDSSKNRIDIIKEIIEECQLGIHDLSRIELDKTSPLPRFNMPLELGLFLGAKYFGNPQQQKKICLIFDEKPFVYQKTCSDIAGKDISYHNRCPEQVIRRTREWLQSTRKKKQIPSGTYIYKRYSNFEKSIPDLCFDLKLDSDDLSYSDQLTLITKWIELNTL